MILNGTRMLVSPYFLNFLNFKLWTTSEAIKFQHLVWPVTSIYCMYSLYFRKHKSCTVLLSNPQTNTFCLDKLESSQHSTSKTTPARDVILVAMTISLSTSSTPSPSWMSYWQSVSQTYTFFYLLSCYFFFIQLIGEAGPSGETPSRPKAKVLILMTKPAGYCCKHYLSHHNC